MTISDVEKRTALPSTAIRYYESRGLIAVRRKENGYRDYDEDTVRILLKIRQLRELCVPLSDIILWRDGVVTRRELIMKRLQTIEDDGKKSRECRAVCEALLRGERDAEMLFPEETFCEEISEEAADVTCPLLLGVDIGTTTISAQVIALDSKNALQIYSFDHNARMMLEGYPDAFCADAERLIERAKALILSILGRYPGIVSIGVTGQMHGIVCTDREGNILSPLYTRQNVFSEYRIDEGLTLTFEVLKKGSLTLTATAKDQKTAKSITLTSEEDTFDTNLSDWTSSGSGTWEKVSDGLKGVTGNDGFMIACKVFEGDFKLELDVTVHSGTAFGIVFCSGDDPASGSYMVNFDLADPVHGQKFRFTEFPYHGNVSNNAECRFDESVAPVLNQKHHIEIVYENGMLTYRFDGELILDQVSDSDSGVSFTGGKLGVMGYNSTFTVNHVKATALGVEEDPDDQPADTTDTPVTTDSPVTTDTHDEKKGGAIGWIAAAVAAVLIGGGVAFAMIKKKKKK